MMHMGRPVDKTGAHVRGKNKHSVGVAVTGNNLVVGQEWSFIQKHILKLLLSVLVVMFPDAQIVGHSDLADTDCPGTDFHFNHSTND